MKPGLSIFEQEHFSERALAHLEEHFDLKPLFTPNVDVLWTRLRMPPDYLERYSFLKAIACNCTDVSHLPLEECAHRGIEVLSLKGIEGLDNVHATAEHTISLMLQALRHRADRSSGRIGRELRGKLALIVGHGRIGRQVTNLLRAFGAGRFLVGCQRAIEWSKTKKYAELEHADIVSIHASLNETSRGMVNAEFLSKLKPGCILVNTARHAIVEEDAILDWLDRDEHAIYAHDFGNKWITNCDDTKCNCGLKRIVATPHIGGWTIESLHKTEELLAEKVIEWAKNHAKQTSTVSSVR